MDLVIRKIRTDLKANKNTSVKKSSQRFFKEPVKCYGMKSAMVDKIAKKCWQEIKSLDKKEIFSLCEELYQSGYFEEAAIVSCWLPKLVDQFKLADLAIFEAWIKKYITNWANCDGLCNHTLGSLIEKYPEALSRIKTWTRSKNRWLRRAAAVSLIIPAKAGKFLEEIFEIADRLLLDQDDLVQKGYGWLLKEASRLHRKEVFNYVMKNKKEMPRTALRYAIELMSKDLKLEAMKRE